MAAPSPAASPSARRSPFHSRARCMRHRAAAPCTRSSSMDNARQRQSAGVGRGMGGWGAAELEGTMGASGPSKAYGRFRLLGRKIKRTARRDDGRVALLGDAVGLAEHDDAESNQTERRTEWSDRKTRAACAQRCAQMHQGDSRRQHTWGTSGLRRSAHSECAFIRAAAADLHNVGDLSR